MQRSEHVVDGVLVKINKAGPRPEYEQPAPDVYKPGMQARPVLQLILHVTG